MFSMSTLVVPEVVILKLSAVYLLFYNICNMYLHCIVVMFNHAILFCFSILEGEMTLKPASWQHKMKPLNLRIGLQSAYDYLEIQPLRRSL